MNKGISISMNLVIVVIVAMIILAVLASFFTSQYLETGSSLNIEKYFNLGCIKLADNGCDHTTLNEIRFANNMISLGNICAEKGITDSIACSRMCGCILDPHEQGIALFAESSIDYFAPEGRPETFIFTTEV
ncbi:hypothetical protein ACFLQN_02670 [Candidatus Aenigmatarchaeota archaeon]